LNKKNVTNGVMDGSGLSIFSTERNGTAEGTEALVALWVMTGASVAEAAANGTSTTGNCGS
jgi:hypothetical protein